MSAERLIASLLRVAKEDLDGARLLAAAANRNAIYLCEQAAEKIIRAVLTSESLHGGIKHQLDEMVDMVPDANPLKSALRGVEYLSGYATAYRYPSPGGRITAPPSPTVLNDSVEKVADLLADVSARFGVDLVKRDTPANNARPIR